MQRRETKCKTTKGSTKVPWKWIVRREWKETSGTTNAINTAKRNSVRAIVSAHHCECFNWQSWHHRGNKIQSCTIMHALTSSDRGLNGCVSNSKTAVTLSNLRLFLAIVNAFFKRISHKSSLIYGQMLQDLMYCGMIPFKLASRSRFENWGSDSEYARSVPA